MRPISFLIFCFPSVLPFSASAQGMMNQGGSQGIGGSGMMNGGMMNMMGGGMMRMMGNGGLDWGFIGLFGWIWLVTWTVISILLGWFLWVLIQRYKNKK